MNKQNSSLFLLFCALFSIILSCCTWGLSFFFKFELPVYVLFVIFFFCFALSYLFFNFFYQKIIFGRIEKTLTELRKLHTTNQFNNQHSTFNMEVSDPIERFNAEILQLSNERQKELEHLQKLENYRKEFLG